MQSAQPGVEYGGSPLLGNKADSLMDAHVTTFMKRLGWKYTGYPEFSRWMASDDDFFVFRRFNRMQARTVLWMQDHLVCLEEQLNKIDQACVDLPIDHAQGTNHSFRDDAAWYKDPSSLKCRRERLMREIAARLKDFSRLPIVIHSFG